MNNELVLNMTNVDTYPVYSWFPYENFDCGTVDMLVQAGALQANYHPMGVRYQVRRQITVTNPPSKIVVAPYKPPSPSLRKN